MAQELLMTSAYNSGPSTQEGDDPNIGAILEKYSGYISDQVKKLVGRYSKSECISMLDREDIAQLVLIKFWLASKKKHITHPQAYIKRMVHNEFVNVLRGCKRTIPISLAEEDTEIQDGATMLIPCEEKDLPETQVEQKDSATHCAHRVARAIAALAPRQKRAIECSLHDHLDDPKQFKDAFEVYGLNIEDARWPTKQAEKLLLKASLSAARTRVARLMKVDLARYKHKSASYL